MSDKEIRKDDNYAQEFTIDELENISGGEKISNGREKDNWKRKAQRQVPDRPSQRPDEV